MARRGAAEIVPALLVAACAGPVTVTMRNGTVYEGKPITNDATRLVIETDEERLVLCKRHIADVDHPGNGAAITGLILIPVGVGIALAATLPQEEQRAGSPILVSMAMATPGIVLAVGGGRRWHEAKEATGWPPATGAQALDERCVPYAIRKEP